MSNELAAQWEAARRRFLRDGTYTFPRCLPPPDPGKPDRRNTSSAFPLVDVHEKWERERQAMYVGSESPNLPSVADAILSLAAMLSLKFRPVDLLARADAVRIACETLTDGDQTANIETVILICMDVRSRWPIDGMVPAELRRIASEMSPGCSAGETCQPGDGTPDGAYLSVRTLSEVFDVPHAKLEQRLKRFRQSNHNPDAWIENEERSRRDPKYLHRVGAVRYILNDLRQSCDS